MDPIPFVVVFTNSVIVSFCLFDWAKSYDKMYYIKHTVVEKNILKH